MGELFKKYGKIFQLGHKENEALLQTPYHTLFIEEKIDGANARFMKTEQGIMFGSRTQELDEESLGNWKRWVDYIKGLYNKNSESFLQGYIYYGEAILKHSINYDFEKMPPFIGYDVYDIHEGVFVDYETKRGMFELIGCEIVPLIKKVPVSEIKGFTDEDIPKSAYYDGQAEGIVIKDYESQIFAKYVTARFKEVNKEQFGKTKKEARKSGDEELIIATYCPNIRIEKAVLRLYNEGHSMDMTMMHYLPKAVFNDLIEENWREILTSNHVIDLKMMRKLLTTRCLVVLKQVMINTALNGRGV